MLKERATAKFDETVEIAMNLGVDRAMPTRTCAAWSISCRTAPASSVRVAVFAKGDKAEEAKAAGADLSAPTIWPRRSRGRDRIRPL